jgi:GAF domain-containing protein
MRENESGTKWTTRHLPVHHRSSCKKQTDLQGENDILELISVGAPLPVVLNSLCTAIDLQIGNVVSVVLMPDDAEHNLQAIVEGARQFGLHVFWSASIPLLDEQILGSFEMYCCVPRMPSPFELRLIQRVTELAGLAILSHHGESELGGPGSEWESGLQKRSYEVAQLN